MDLFDIIGPVMIGPSSSHTAGAARIGLVARRLLGQEPVRCEIRLHGSFAETCRGHGTDRALTAGLLGMQVDDPRLRDSLKIAQEQGLEVTFQKVEIPDAHPNTAVLSLTGREGGKLEMRASSVGGGNIRIDGIDEMAVSFRAGSGNILVVRHRDQPGVIARVSTAIAQSRVNIATMQVFRSCEGGQALMVIEIDAPADEALLEALRRCQHVENVVSLGKF